MEYIKNILMIKVLILPILSSLLLAAHFSRIQNDWLALLALCLPFILFIKRKWILSIFQIYLIAGGVIWMQRMVFLQQQRAAAGEPWVRLVLILSLVALVTFFSALLMGKKKIQHLYQISVKDKRVFFEPSLIAFLLTAALLIIVHLQVDPPILLLERFLPGAGGIEIFLLSLYAAWITEKMLDVKKSPKLRRLIWIFFSLVFFTQFILGIAGLAKFLMTGKLHLPIPAIIIAGPLFRGQGFFMLILFTAMVILVGSAWCSHLCYLGSWENLAIKERTKPQTLPRWWNYARLGILMLIILSALLFRFLGMNTYTAIGLALVYGLGGVVIMLFLSRKKGVMIHCTVYCPIGLIANLFGKITLFRIRFNSKCDDCGLCRNSCRYHALEKNNIQERKPGLSCTLCGDCLSGCPKKALYYKFPGIKPDISRKIFITLVIVLHSIFLGVARL